MSEATPHQDRRGFLWWFALAGILAVGLFFRFRDFNDQVLAGDEYHALRAAMNYDFFSLLTHYETAENSIPMSMYARALMTTVGLTEWSFRIPAVGSALVILLSPFLFRRSLGSSACLLATALIAVCPMAIYFTFVGRPYGPGAMFMVLALVGWRAWIENQTKKALGFFTVSAALGVFFHLLCLMPVAWLVTMSWVAVRAGKLERGPALRMTGLLLLLGLALQGPGIPGLLEYRLIGSHRPGVGNPQLAWTAFLRLCGEHPSTTLAFLALAVCGSVRLVRRERLFGITMAGMMPALLLGMFITQPWPTDHAWARYQYLAQPLFLMLVGLGAVWLLEVLGRALMKRWPLAVVSFGLAGVCLYVRVGEPIGVETPLQAAWPWIVGAALAAAALGSLLSSRARSEGAANPGVHVSVAVLTILWTAGSVAWTPVPILQESVDSLRTARRSVQLLSDEMRMKWSRRLPKFYETIAEDSDAGSVLLVWPYTVDTSQWKGVLAAQSLHRKRVVFVNRGPLRTHHESGIRFRNQTDRKGVKSFVARGARYFVINLDCVTGKIPGIERGPNPFKIKGAPVDLKTYHLVREFLTTKYGEPIERSEHIEVYDMLAKAD